MNNRILDHWPPDGNPVSSNGALAGLAILIGTVIQGMARRAAV